MINCGDLISVVVPAYNAGATLCRCVESVIAQDYTHWELIIVNDGSVDDTAEIADRLLESDGRVRVINQPNAGVSAARNQGIEAANGDWILFLDSDDYLLPYAMANLIPSATDVDVVRSSYETPSTRYEVSRDRMLLDGRQCISAATNPRVFRKVCSGTPLSKRINLKSVWAGIYSRQVLSEYSVRFTENLRFGEDCLFNIETFRWARKVEFVDVSTYFYDTSSSSTCRSFELRDIEDLARFANEVYARLSRLCEESLIDADAPASLLAQETITLLSRAAHFGDRARTDPSEVCATLMNNELIRGSLESFKPNKIKRLISWPIERFLLYRGLYSLVVLIERLRWV